MKKSDPAGAGRLIYAASNTCAPLLYESGFNAEDPFLWFSCPKMTATVVSSLELGRARKQGRRTVAVLDREKLRQELGLPPANAQKMGTIPFPVRQILDVSEAMGTTCWQVPGDFPLALANRLTALGITLTTVDDFCPGRRVKSAHEVDCIRHAQRLAEAGLDRADQILSESAVGDDGFLRWHDAVLTAEILRGELNAEIVRRGGIPTGTITAPGTQGADPHQAGTGPIAANVPIVMDIFPRDEQSGYFGDLTRTRVKGHAADEVRRAYETVLAAQQQVLEALRPGLPASQFHQMTAGYFKECGYNTAWDASANAYHGFFHGLGHSVGLEIHEEPSLRPPDHTLLEAGHVVTVEPGLYYPSWGGIRIEDTVAITGDGIDNLTVAGKFLEID